MKAREKEWAQDKWEDFAYLLLLGIETDVWSVWIFKFWATKQFLVMQHNIMLHWSLFGWMRSWKKKKNYFFIRRITKRIRLTCKVISTKWTNCIESIEDYQLLNGFSMIMPDSLLKIFKAALYRICISNSGTKASNYFLKGTKMHALKTTPLEITISKLDVNLIWISD